MTLTAEKQTEHIGETKGGADLVHELNKRPDALWRDDQYIANAGGRSDCQSFWKELKQQDQQNVDRLKHLVAAEIENECF